MGERVQTKMVLLIGGRLIVNMATVDPVLLAVPAVLTPSVSNDLTVICALLSRCRYTVEPGERADVEAAVR